jgi:septal ring factor EnvC (AmiA/AmiB activator)
MRAGPTVVVQVVLAVVMPAAATDPPASDQLELVRSRIGALEERLSVLDAENRTRQEEREKLTAELELAEARVREIEILVGRSRQEAEAVAAAAAVLADELERHRKLLEGHIEMMALLGRPGTVQLLYDGARGGELEGAIGTVAVLTSGQLRLVEEYGDLRRRRSARMAELSRVLDQARAEAVVLADRRIELEAVRSRVDAEIQELSRSQRSAASELDELRQREQALERLLATLADRRRFAGGDDIRKFRGALPWPVRGRIVRGFGKRYLPKYSTYTVCNGLRFDAPSGAAVSAVFPGEVAYARFFKGYGNMVVVDHGHDVYSLAAGLATIHVRVNQRVDMGLRLGLASPPSEEGNTYFEIRVGKKPQDPRRWLQLRPKSPRGVPLK